MFIRWLTAITMIGSTLLADPSTPMMPLKAMGYQENYNLYLLAKHRLNPQQLPRTNNLQLWQTKMQTGFGLAPTNRLLPSEQYFFSAFRTGAHYATLGLTGPVIAFPCNAELELKTQDGHNCSTLRENTRDLHFVFGAWDAVSRGPALFAENQIATEIHPLGQSLNVTYTLNAAQKITDSVVLGNFFHDIYFQNITPVIIASHRLQFQPRYYALDGQSVQSHRMAPSAQGDMVSIASTAFVFPIDVQNESFHLLIFKESSDGAPIHFKINQEDPTQLHVCNEAGQSVPYSGWLRFAVLPKERMPLLQTGNAISTKTLTQMQTELYEQLQAADTLTHYTLFPYAWSDRALKLLSQSKQWQAPALSFLGWTSDTQKRFAALRNEPPSAKSHMSTLFEMGWMSGQRTAIQALQDSFTRPVYTQTWLTKIEEMVTALLPYRHAIPIAVEAITFNSGSMTWKYTTDTSFSTQGNTSSPLLCFPGWLKLHNTEALLPLRYDSVLKGKIFAAPAADRAITFTEDTWPAWLEAGETLPTQDLATLFGAQAAEIFATMDELYKQERLSWISPTQLTPGMTANGVVIPLFPEAEDLLDGKRCGQSLMQLTQAARHLATYLTYRGKLPEEIQYTTAPIINALKRILTDFLITHPIDQNHFVADATHQGLCFFGNPHLRYLNDNPDYPLQSAVALEQQSYAGALLEQGNAIYNHHITQYGPFLHAAAAIIAWDARFLANHPSSWWIHQNILGADMQLYKNWHFVDLLWRDTVNPFLEPDLPFMRTINLWESHGSTLGIQNIDPYAIQSPTAPGLFMPAGLRSDHIVENYNTLSGAFLYAAQMLRVQSQLQLTPSQTQMYQQLKDAMLINMKMHASCARVLFYMVGKGYVEKGEERGSIYPPSWTHDILSVGAVADREATAQP